MTTNATQTTASATIRFDKVIVEPDYVTVYYDGFERSVIFRRFGSYLTEPSYSDIVAAVSYPEDACGRVRNAVSAASGN